MWFATSAGIWFVGTRPLPGLRWTHPDTFSALLNPPEPPFVAALPLFGINGGGEANLERAILRPHPDPKLAARIRECTDPAIATLIGSAPDSVKPEHVKRQASLAIVQLIPPWDSALDWPALRAAVGQYQRESWWRATVWPLLKLQSKNVILGARVSESRQRYHLQVDDAADFVLDVGLWYELRGRAELLLYQLRAAGVRNKAASEALRTLIPPPGCKDMWLMARWHRFTERFMPHRHAIWWPIFAALLQAPESGEE